MKLINKKILIVLTAMLMMSVGDIYARRWKQHPAMDDSPMRIIDTENYTFIQAFQKLYSRSTGTHDTPVTAGFIYRKDNPEAGIVPMAQSVALNGGSIRTCEYSPEGGFLAILYLDGGVDIVYDSGETKYNEALKYNYSPDWSIVNSMTISGTEIWIATTGGFMVIDGTNGALIHKADISENLKWVARCGDRIIGFTDNRIYQASGDRLPRRFSDFTLIDAEGMKAVPQMLMPREDGAFFYLTAHTSPGHYAVNIAYRDNDVWKSRWIRDIWLSVIPANSVLTNPFERTFTRNKEGWSFFTTADLFQLYNARPSTTDEVLVSIPIRSKADRTKVRNVSFLGSWDSTSCVAYFDRGKFSFGERTDGPMLIDDSTPLRPNAPAVPHAPQLGYAPGHGTLAVNYGCCSLFSSILNNFPALLSMYDAGKWTLPNPVYVVPRSAETNPELSTLYRNNLKHFPITTPTGLSVDPLNPDYVWFGSTYYGLAALNVADPKRDPINLGAKSDALAAYPGFKAIYDDCTRWKGYHPSSTPSFDGEGNMWWLYNNYDAPLSNGSQAQLYCWKAKNREKVLSSGDVDSMEPLEPFLFPEVGSFNAMMKCLATSHPSSRNTILMFIPGTPRHIYRFNHGGTLSDPSDDRMDKIYAIEDQNGGRWEIYACYDMKEDPQTGLIWLGEDDTLLCFDPTSEVKDGVIKGRVLDATYEDLKGNPLAFKRVHGITFDDSNRLWVTTGGAGVWGISSDRKEVLAHYTVENSGLPSDIGYGIVWNPDSRSLMISTAEGLAEVWPDLPLESPQLKAGVAVYPREVGPDYSGSVTVKGVMPNVEVAVCRLDGSPVATVRSNAEGTASWHLTDDSGRMVKTGFYVLKGSFGEVEIAVMR